MNSGRVCCRRPIVQYEKGEQRKNKNAPELSRQFRSASDDIASQFRYCEWVKGEPIPGFFLPCAQIDGTPYAVTRVFHDFHVTYA